MEQRWPFSKPLEFLHKVKYGGAVGKKTVISVVTLIVLAIGLISAWGNVNAVYGIVGVVVLVFFGSLLSIDKTLKIHPELALMDGAEYVSFKQLQSAAKGLLSPPGEPSIAGPLKPEPPDAGGD